MVGDGEDGGHVGAVLLGQEQRGWRSRSVDFLSDLVLCQSRSFQIGLLQGLLKESYLKPKVYYK